jgi:glycogen synthase
MWAEGSLDAFRRELARYEFVMLRYETEYTPCTGITAVARQERRHFTRGYTIAPWCPHLSRAPEQDPLLLGRVKATPWTFPVNGIECRVFITDDGLPPIVFLHVEGRFLGVDSPYDTPAESDVRDGAYTLRTDALHFGIAVDEWLRGANATQQFIWAADWETVPALTRVQGRHLTALTLHNTFDTPLDDVAAEFGDAFLPFLARRPGVDMLQTALEVGLRTANVATTVNRGFAHGMQSELLQRVVMAPHLQGLLSRVVGINNAAFEPISGEVQGLRRALAHDRAEGLAQLLDLKAAALRRLPPEIANDGEGKAIIVCMGRRVAQKQHDVLVESLAALLRNNPALPLFVVFATVPGDDGSESRLRRMVALAERYPRQVVCFEKRIPFYSELMAAADFNCMPSLWEPHGGAFAGTVIPIARAVDGLAEQICAYRPAGEAARINRLWHHGEEAPTGFLFRESVESAEDLDALLRVSPSPDNAMFRAMCDALTDTLLAAVEVRLNEPLQYAALVEAALGRQLDQSWLLNLGGMLSLIEQARSQRPAA